jgi:AraC-like DNA-binding protein
MKMARFSESKALATPEFFSRHVSAARRFYLGLNPPRERVLAVVCGGYEQSTPDYAIHRTTFPYYTIEYVARGRGTVKLGGRPYVLQSGRLFAYGPGVPQDILCDPDEPLVKYFVNFTGRKSLALLQSCHLPPGKALQIFPPNEVQGVFDELIRCGQKGTRQTAHLCVKLLECLAIQITESRAPLEGAETRAFTTYQDCRRYIQGNFIQLKTLEQIARARRADAAYLCRLFRRYDHQSPYQYLLRLKMNQAAEFLQQPGALVKQVAEHAGFGDPFHFSRAFKSVFGLSPDSFRRLRWSGQSKMFPSAKNASQKSGIVKNPSDPNVVKPGIQPN